MKVLKEILENPWVASLVVFTIQILMLYMRTKNIAYTIKHNIFGAIWTNNAFAVAWLFSTTIGLNSMISGQWQPIVAFLLGGSLGTYWGVKKDKKDLEKSK
jgi:hypothetical protein